MCELTLGTPLPRYLYPISMRPATETYPLIPLYTPLTRRTEAMKEADTLRKASEPKDPGCCFGKVTVTDDSLLP
jgi:hypothetical protein